MKSIYNYRLLLFFSTLVFGACGSDDNDMPQEITEFIDNGTGVYNFIYDDGDVEKIIRVYYHIPENVARDARILLVFHGAGRNARDYRDALIAPANSKKFIVVAPEFSITNFPNGDAYNLGNVYIDGDQPSATTLNEERKWAFSIIDPLFDNLLLQIDNSSTTYDIFGHSAGAQFAHRLLMFLPQSRVDKVVASAAGWYTFPDTSISFPYGFDNSILSTTSLSNFYTQNLHIQVGANDNDPNAANLRRNTQADAQGLHRRSRAENFFNYAQQQTQNTAIPFNWSFSIIPLADHDFRIAATNAATFLYN
jgi:pimeloyl-ACP methyl ester carboxylesterase